MARLAALALILGGCVGGEDLPPPRLASIVPDRGPPGIVAQLTGTDFCQSPDHGSGDTPCAPSDAQVFFVTTTAETSIIDDTSATTVVPVLPPGSQSLYLSVAGRRSNELDFIVELP